jgi:transcriptional regulator with XRE-family HTH domain
VTPVSSRRRARATHVDQEVGKAMRRRRIACGISQRLLAEALGVRCQQIQKYESGANRLSPAKLLDAAACLDGTVADFFADVDGPAPAALATREAMALLAPFVSLKSPEVQRALAALIRAIAASKEPPR